MPSCSDVDPASVFTSLADIVHQGSTPKAMYAAICVAATLMVPGCDHASLMIRRDGACSTAAVSDPVAHKIGKLEQALGTGPCLDAIEEQTAQIATDLTTSGRWPVLAARVVAETPVRGAMSIRLPVDRAQVGALNLFSDSVNAFDNTSVERAIVLAAFATVATNATAQGEDFGFSLFAEAYIGLGEKDEAMAWLERAYEEHDQWMVYINSYPGWDDLRSEPRFQALVQRVELPGIGGAHSQWSHPFSRPADRKPSEAGHVGGNWRNQMR